MSELAFSLVTGIISGVIATFLIVIFAWFWRTVVEPWYENLVYKDARIEGRWGAKGIFDFLGQGRLEEEFTWTLTRVGHSVKGIIVCVSGPDKGLTYDVVGTFRNLVLTATYTSQNPATLH